MKKTDIVVSDEKLDWKEAIKEAGKILLNKGSIESSYTEAMILAVHSFGPYIAIAPGIAIAHAEPGKGVIENDIALLISKKGIEFHSKNDPVHVLFAFCTVSSDEHLKSLSEIAEMISVDGFVEKMIQVNTIDEAYQLLQ